MSGSFRCACGLRQAFRRAFTATFAACSSVTPLSATYVEAITAWLPIAPAIIGRSQIGSPTVVIAPCELPSDCFSKPTARMRP